MAALGNVYQIKMVCTHALGQTSELNFYYEVSTAGTALATQVKNAFQDLHETAFSTLMHSDWTITAYQVINGMFNTDFKEQTVSIAGTLPNDGLPPALTFLVRAPRELPGDIPAMRRFPWGDSSTFTVSLGEWDGGFLASVEAVVDDLSDTLSPTGGDVLDPVQLTGGFILGFDPVVLRKLLGEWQYAKQPGWLRSREPDLDWLQAI